MTVTQLGASNKITLTLGLAFILLTSVVSASAVWFATKAEIANNSVDVSVMKPTLAAEVALNAAQEIYIKALEADVVEAKAARTYIRDRIEAINDRTIKLESTLDGISRATGISVPR